LAKLHQDQDETFAAEESLVSRNIEATPAETPAVESAAVSLAITMPAPEPVERKAPKAPSLLSRLFAALKGLFASEPKQEEKNKKVRSNNRNVNNRNRRNQDRRNNRRVRNENVENVVEEQSADKSEVRNRHQDRNAKRSRKPEVIEEIIKPESSTPVTEEKAEPAQRRQRRDLRKKVRVYDEVNDIQADQAENVSFVENANVAHAPDESIVSAEATEISNEPERNNRDNSRQRRLPRHLRVNNQRRRRNQQEKSPMPLFAAVASPELASGKVWIDMTQVNQPKETPFLSVDELLEQQNQSTAETEKSITVPALDMIVEKAKNEVQPLTEFITQPANESVEKKIQASLERLNNNVTSEPTAAIAKQLEPKAEHDVKFMAEIDRTYVFNGRVGTFSAVAHTKADSTLAKASDEPITTYPVQEWQESRYYFYGKGAAGHHTAISHVYAEPTKAESEN
jgi:ribonuclease E